MSTPIQWASAGLNDDERALLLECWCLSGGWLEIGHPGRRALYTEGSFFFIDEGGTQVQIVEKADVITEHVRLCK